MQLMKNHQRLLQEPELNKNDAKPTSLPPKKVRSYLFFSKENVRIWKGIFDSHCIKCAWNGKGKEGVDLYRISDISGYAKI